MSTIDALFGATQRAVLALFFTHPDERFHLRAVVRHINAGTGAVQRELKRLTDAGILSSRREGHQVYFSANGDCPLFPELSGLIAKTVGVVDAVRRALSPLADRICVAFVYGSYARGEQRSGSDVDVMIVGRVSFADVVHVLRPIQEKLAAEINPTIYSPSEWAEKLARKHHFLTTVVCEAKIFLIGGERELGAVAQ